MESRVKPEIWLTIGLKTPFAKAKRLVTPVKREIKCDEETKLQNAIYGLMEFM
jgi:hypothetical protein